MMMTSKDVSAIEAPVRSYSRGAANAAFQCNRDIHVVTSSACAARRGRYICRISNYTKANKQKRHKHLHRADGFAEPLDVINAIVDEAENGDQQRHQTQDMKPAPEVKFTITAPCRKAIDDEGNDHIDHDQNRPEGLAERAAGGVIPVRQQ